ncbi:hypothetical protein QTH90_30935 [Variovorax sp. J2P1-59]|uniref:hypothetical protein n=1 Tax=Variovorax flavidus TaxID=3053501 RepID=UPI002576E97B|nr:hypothetical protein [Variovorax sp. J2P1-59]MDM0078857.1 hypothetical protein [Variovorax sp. J2P1-59]
MSLLIAALASVSVSWFLFFLPTFGLLIAGIFGLMLPTKDFYIERNARRRAPQESPSRRGDLSVERHSDSVDLKTQAELVFSALGVTVFEERFSPNYPPDGHYFMGFALNAAIEVCEAEEEGANQYPYWVIVGSPERRNGLGLLPSDPSVLASILTSAGMHSRPLR